jgi:predicted aminopeptidase
MAAYNDEVPAFEALLAREGGDFPRFFAEVRKLAALDTEQRDAALRALAGTTTAVAP